MYGVYQVRYHTVLYTYRVCRELPKFKKLSKKYYPHRELPDFLKSVKKPLSLDLFFIRSH